MIFNQTTDPKDTTQVQGKNEIGYFPQIKIQLQIKIQVDAIDIIVRYFCNLTGNMTISNLNFFLQFHN